jgi:hypothetical protein
LINLRDIYLVFTKRQIQNIIGLQKKKGQIQEFANRSAKNIKLF